MSWLSKFLYELLPYTEALDVKDEILIYQYSSGKTKRIRVEKVISDNEFEFPWDSEITYDQLDIVSFNGDLYEAVQSGNIGNAPVEGQWWTKLNKVVGSTITEHKPGAYGKGLVIVHHAYAGGIAAYAGIKLWELTVPEAERPFNSTNISAEIDANKWLPVHPVGAGGGSVDLTVYVSKANAGTEIELTPSTPSKWGSILTAGKASLIAFINYIGTRLGQVGDKDVDAASRSDKRILQYDSLSDKYKHVAANSHGHSADDITENSNKVFISAELRTKLEDLPEIPSFPDMVLEGLSISVANNNITVSPGKWLIDQVNYETLEATVLSLDDADPTFDRIDVIIANSVGELPISVVVGTPSENPVKPSIPANSIEIGFAIVGLSTQVQSVGLYVSKTYDELRVLKNSNQLVEGQYYRIADFRTRHCIPNSPLDPIVYDGITTFYPYEVHTEEIEPLIVFAISQNKFSRVAYSTIWPTDLIEYNFDDDKCEEMDEYYGSFVPSSQATPRPGRITSRVDTLRNIKTLGYDFRGVKFRLNKIHLEMGLVAKLDNSTYEVTLQGNSNVVITNKTNIFFISNKNNWGNHTANPQLIVKNSDGTILSHQAELIRHDGLPLTTNGLISFSKTSSIIYDHELDKYRIISGSILDYINEDAEFNDPMYVSLNERFGLPFTDIAGVKSVYNKDVSLYTYTFRDREPRDIFRNVTIEARPIVVDQYRKPEDPGPYNEIVFTTNYDIIENVTFKGCSNITISYNSEMENVDFINCKNLLIGGYIHDSTLENVEEVYMGSSYTSHLENLKSVILGNASDSVVRNILDSILLGAIVNSEFTNFEGMVDVSSFNSIRSNIKFLGVKKNKFILPEAVFENFTDHTTSETVENIKQGKSDVVVFNKIEAENLNYSDPLLKEKVTANGTTSTTLSYAIVSIFQLFINGVLLDSDDYSFAGSSITFDLAPANGALLTVFYKTGDVVSNPPPSSVEFTDVSDSTVEISIIN